MITMTDTTTKFDEIKAKQQVTWQSGDYAKIAWLTVPVAEALVVAADPAPGARVLDVATGTGHAALGAARRFCDVTGIDYVPALIAAARRRADAEGLAVTFREADAENLPFPDGSFDQVLSAIGVMFTADHQRAADELMRVCRPGGRIALANWVPTGFVGQMLAAVARHVTPPAGALPPTRWASSRPSVTCSVTACRSCGSAPPPRPSGSRRQSSSPTSSSPTTARRTRRPSGCPTRVAGRSATTWSRWPPRPTGRPTAPSPATGST
jgi:SAM-dependent methyltransferase